MGLVPTAVLAALDPRRRPVAATVAWAVTLFVIYGATLTRSPAFRPMAPGGAATAVALALTVAAAATGRPGRARAVGSPGGARGPSGVGSRSPRLAIRRQGSRGLTLARICAYRVIAISFSE